MFCTIVICFIKEKFAKLVYFRIVTFIIQKFSTFCFTYNINEYKSCFPGTKVECKNEGQQVQWIKMQNAATTTKQTLLQEKNLTATGTKNNIQNNTPVSSRIGIIFRQKFNCLLYLLFNNHFHPFSHLSIL